MQCNAMQCTLTQFDEDSPQPEYYLQFFFLFRWFNVTQSLLFAMFNWQSEFSAIATSSIKVQYSIKNIATSDIGHTSTKLIAFYAKQNEKMRKKTHTLVCVLCKH